MRVIEKGHIYELSHQDGAETQKLIFVNREQNKHEGTQNQEVLRALIDRVKHCDTCLLWDGNGKIIFHLRMALVLHEARALIRKVEKEEIEPETYPVGDDGHFKLVTRKLEVRLFAAETNLQSLMDHIDKYG